MIKYSLAITIVLMMLTDMHAQTMKWIPMTAGMATSSCPIDKSKKQQLLCYALEYTPGVSGTLTSYTTAFFITCTSLGSPVVKNQSCSMSSNVNLINGCEGNGVVLMNSSGNSGSVANNPVIAGMPVMLHQVCFSIPVGESILITEDQVTDLTTSIDLVTEDVVTEYPAFTETTVYRRKYDISRPSLLDFKAISLGNFVAQLDWTTPDESNTSYFEIERSNDGDVFIPVGKVDTMVVSGKINSYQFLDHQAKLGNNFYRLRQVDLDGNIKYSPVRIVAFVEKPFSVKASPNPADQYILVEMQSPSAETTIKLIDATGRVVIDEIIDNRHLKTRLEVGKLTPGMYTLIVESGNDKFSENVVIIR